VSEVAQDEACWEILDGLEAYYSRLTESNAAVERKTAELANFVTEVLDGEDQSKKQRLYAVLTSLIAALGTRSSLLFSKVLTGVDPAHQVSIIKLMQNADFSLTKAVHVCLSHLFFLSSSKEVILPLTQAILSQPKCELTKYRLLMYLYLALLSISPAVLASINAALREVFPNICIQYPSPCSLLNVCVLLSKDNKTKRSVEKLVRKKILEHATSIRQDVMDVVGKLVEKGAKELIETKGVWDKLCPLAPCEDIEDYIFGIEQLLGEQPEEDEFQYSDDEEEPTNGNHPAKPSVQHKQKGLQLQPVVQVSKKTKEQLTRLDRKTSSSPARNSPPKKSSLKQPKSASRDKKETSATRQPVQAAREYARLISETSEASTSLPSQ